jgi:uncharacterized membrane protein YedE/YeeE
MMDIFHSLVSGAAAIALIISIGVRAYRSMSDEYSDIADEQLITLLGRISAIIVIIVILVILVGSITGVINVTATKIAEATKIVVMIGFVGLAIFIVFAWDRISARQRDEKKDDIEHK